MLRKLTTKLLPLLFLVTMGSLAATYAPISPMYGNRLGEKSQAKIIVHNRPLAKINGKVFSVMDVKKRMDNYLAKAYPEIFTEPESVFQFYVHSWRNVLQEMIDNELMLMEGESLSYKLDKTYIKEELREKYGPNINQKLDELGLTSEEAERTVEDDLICRSLMWYRVWQKSINQVTPEVVKEHYAKQQENRPKQDEWTYQMCTIRGRDAEAAEKLAEDVRKLFSLVGNDEGNQGSLGSALADAVKAVSAITPSGVTVKLSDDIHLTSQQLSTENLSILENMTPLSISEPIKQKSRYDDTTVMRLFFVKEHLVKEPPSFEELESEIREGLVAKEGEKIKAEYMNKLRKRFCCEHLVVDKMYNAQFPVFSLANA